MWLTLLPTLILNSKTEDIDISVRDYAGWALWLIGVVIEAVADYQKYTFHSNQANRYSCSLYSRQVFYILYFVSWLPFLVPVLLFTNLPVC